MDNHKYGLSPSNVSIILYRTQELRRYQFYTNMTWEGGIYCTPGFPGSRSSGPTAGAWYVMKHLGRDGYFIL